MKNNGKKELSTTAKVLALVLVGFLVFGTLAATVMAIAQAL
jgi:hypothetical protein